MNSQVEILAVGEGLIEGKSQELAQAHHAPEQAQSSIEKRDLPFKESVANYHALLQSHPDGMVVVSQDNSIQFVNPAAEVMLQRSAAALLNTTLDFSVVENEAGEVSILGSTSELIIAEMRATATAWEGAPATLVTFRDVSARKKKEDSLRRAKEEAEALTQTKAEILATMSHELRTPLNGIIGMSDLLLLTFLTEEQSDFANRVKANAQSLLNIINQTLDFSKIEAKKLTLDVIDFDLHTTLDSVTEIFTKSCADKSLELAVVTSHDVPAALRGDPGRLRQILTNLTGNAVKFTETGEVVVRISVVEETDTRVLLHFAVTDTGIGISLDHIGRLFQSFSQADTSQTQRYGGTGLGLAISKQLVELMDGEIGVDSELGNGSMFWFTARFEKQQEKVTSLEPAFHTLQGVRALIVEENATVRTSLVSHLASWGMKTDSASSAAQAIELLNAAVKTQRPFRVAVVDWYLPEVDGVMLAQTIRTQPALHDLRLVLLTSVGQRGDGARARAVGIQAYLTKPLRRSQLFKCLNTVLSQPVTSENEPASLVTRHTLAEAEADRVPRILVVDDNIDSLVFAVRLLKKFGYRTDVANNGQEALAALDRQEYAAILMDCQMPVMDGFTATTQIRNRERAKGIRTLIFACTANVTENNRQHCFHVGMDDFITKPLQQDTFVAMLEKWRITKPLPEADSLISQGWPPLPFGNQRSRILLVEDNDTGQKVAVGLLNSLGYREVDVVASGREALEAIVRHPYAVVLMDYQLPEMNGVTTTAYIRVHDRQRGTHTPVIAFTARANEHDREKFLAVGMDAYVAKPIDRDELKAAVEPWMRSPLQRELTIPDAGCESGYASIPEAFPEVSFVPTILQKTLTEVSLHTKVE